MRLAKTNVALDAGDDIRGNLQIIARQQPATKADAAQIGIDRRVGRAVATRRQRKAATLTDTANMHADVGACPNNGLRRRIGGMSDSWRGNQRRRGKQDFHW